MSQPIISANLSAFAYETVTVAGTAIGLTAATGRKQVGETASDFITANAAFVTVEVAEIRWNFVPGLTPTASTNGHLSGINTYFWLYGQQIRDFKAIRTGGTSGELKVTYFI